MLESYRYDTLYLPWMATFIEECRKEVYGGDDISSKIDLINNMQTLLRQWSNVYNFSVMKWGEAKQLESFFTLLLEKLERYLSSDL